MAEHGRAPPPTITRVNRYLWPGFNGWQRQSYKSKRQGIGSVTTMPPTRTLDVDRSGRAREVQCKATINIVNMSTCSWLNGEVEDEMILHLELRLDVQCQWDAKQRTAEGEGVVLPSLAAHIGVLGVFEFEDQFVR